MGETMMKSSATPKIMMRAMAMAFCVLMAHFLHLVECETLIGASGGVGDGGSSTGGRGPSASLSNAQSSRKADLCASCRGDNTTCRTVSGIFSRPQLNVGYNLVAHIPRGACNLSISEMRRSPNHLALQRRDGSFIFNGDWRLSQSGEYHDAGTSFYYKRQDLKSLESITSPGPVQEPLDLMVLYQQPNPVIRYEYLISLPTAAAVITPEHLVSSRPLSLGASPTSYAQYATGMKVTNTRPSPSALTVLQQPQQHPALLPSSIINPYNSVNQFPVSGAHDLAESPTSYPGAEPYSNPHLYNVVHQLSTHGRRHDRFDTRGERQLSNVGSVVSQHRKFYWKVIGYTNCSEPCAGGSQKSIVRCVKSQNGNPVADRRCNSEERPISQTIRCNLTPCPAEWVVSDWSNCNAECGEGHRTRSVLCRQKVSQVLTMQVAEGACLQSKPSSTQPCQLKACHRWHTSEWSQCSAQCGSGIRKRTVICVGPNGQRLSKEECENNDIPPEISPCNMGPCEGVDWFVSEWTSECSQKCGPGIQTRHVVCSSIKQQHLKSFYSHLSSDSSFNTSKSNYPKKSRLYSSSSEVESSNFIGDNDIFAHDNDTSSNRDFVSNDIEQFSCDESRKPLEERECISDENCGQLSWFTGTWGECSSTCGTGLQTRQVLCIQFSRGKFKIAPDTLCPQEKKPTEKQSCRNSEKCSQRWFTTEWTECSAECGGGIQRRSVSCRASNWTLPSSLCHDLDRPVERRSCNEQKCTQTQSSLNNEDVLRDNAQQLTESPHNHNNLHYQTFQEANQQQQPPSPSTQISVEFNEEADVRSCTDAYRNCALVVQARLCRYKYYRSVCCRSCSDTQ